MQFVVEPKQPKDIALLKYAGGTAMVVATSFFSAGRLTNIKEEEIKEYKEECERLEVQLFVLVTRMFVDAEMPRLQAFLLYLKELQVDGIYFSDLSVLVQGKELGIAHLLIYQPDTLITNSKEAKLYLNLGIKAIGAAKELTLEELCEISSDNPDQVEVMIHGIPLMSASKRMLISNYFDEIEYQGQKKTFYHITEEKREAKMPVIEDEQGTHLFGGYCLYSYDEIKTLQHSKVGYVRIDGNFLDTVSTLIALRGYVDVLHNRMGVEAVKTKVQAQSPELSFTSGFYYTKTSATKEGQS